jgi:hypothetical protein
MADIPAEKPFRVGIFRTAAEASKAIDALLAAGFKKEELAVVCADQSVEKFRDIPHPSPGPARRDDPMKGARTIEGVLGGAALAAAAIASGGFGVPGGEGVIVEGEALVMPGHVRDEEGGPVGPLYAQAVRDGHVLVAVELPDEGASTRLPLAEQILKDHGSDPSLAEG